MPSADAAGRYGRRCRCGCRCPLPQAITAVMLLVLDLLWRGYRVVLSTHSPHVLTMLWMMRQFKKHNARWQLVCDAFDVPQSQQMQRVAEAALEKDYRAHLLQFGTD